MLIATYTIGAYAHVGACDPVPALAKGGHYCECQRHIFMSEDEAPIRYDGFDARGPGVMPGIASPAPFTPGGACRATGRHAAIATQLPNWYSYKSWADKAKLSWDEPK
jgi:hypothetical protein